MEQSKRTKMVRINEGDHAILAKLAAEMGLSVPECLHKVIKEYRRLSFWEGLAEDHRKAEAEDSYWAERARRAEESGWAGEEESVSLLKERQAEEVEKRACRDQFFTELDESVKRHQDELAKNPEHRKEEEEEQRLWDNTLMDGLEDE